MIVEFHADELTTVVGDFRPEFANVFGKALLNFLCVRTTVPMLEQIQIADRFRADERAVVYHGNCLDLLKAFDDSSVQLIVTSPPYNVGKEYESRVDLNSYVKEQESVIRECVRALKTSVMMFAAFIYAK